MTIRRIFLNFLLSVVTLLCFTQCDTTSAEEYKAQAVGYAESGEHQKAAEAYMKAAEKGDSEAQFMIGVLYMVGSEMPNNPFNKDDKASLEWIERSAQQGNIDAMCVAGILYSRESKYKNIQKAIKYWEDAEYQNSPLAAYLLGDLYDTGENMLIDKQKAIIHYSMAYDMGCLSAGLRLSRLYLDNPDTFDKGMTVFQESEQKIRNIGCNPQDPIGLFQYEFLKIYQKFKI